MLATLLAGMALAAPTVGCQARAEAPPPSPSERREAMSVSITVRTAIFWGLRRARHEPFGGDRGPFWKSGLSVFAPRAMTISVAPRDRSWLSLRYGDQDGVPTIRFRPCRPDTKRFSGPGTVGLETIWAGGFNVLRPGCATLRLRRAGDKRWTAVRVGFGRACP